MLKQWGCRWSKRQKAWYFIGQTLPEAVQNLIDELNTQSEFMSDDKDDPCTIEEATTMLGVAVKQKSATPHTLSDEIPRLFELGGTVYARYELETPDGRTIPAGTVGIITRLCNRNPTHGWSYDVDFTGMGTGWYFEHELTSLEPLPGIRVTHGRVIPPGAVPPASDMDIKRALIEGDCQPEGIDEDQETPLPDEEQPKVRVIKPSVDMTGDEEVDAVLRAIRQTKTEPLPSQQLSHHTTSNRRTLASIPQSPCGELTGSITGNVWCYGWAKHEDICVYVNFGGPRMAVEAIRAKFIKDDIVNCALWDAPTVELTAGEGNTGKYTAFMQNIPEAKFTSLILLHELMIQPNYGGQSTTFIFHVSDEQAMAQLRQHITRLVKVPVFPEWTSYLWQAGQNAMLLRPTPTGGDVKLWTVDLDTDAWTRLITGGLAQQIIQFPN